MIPSRAPGASSVGGRVRYSDYGSEGCAITREIRRRIAFRRHLREEIGVTPSSPE